MKLPQKKILSVDLYFIIILSVYFFSRLYIHLILKIEFAYYLKDYLIQFLDVDLLKNNLFTSLFYLHSQPPLFNFFIGLSEIVFGNYSAIIFSFLFNLMGLLTAILGYKIFESLDVNKILSVTLIIIYILSPATILFENFFFYTHPIIFFLVFSAYHLIVYLKYDRNINALLFFVGLSFAILTTSFFHLAWFLILFYFLFLLNKSKLWTLLKVAAIPFLIVLSVYLKNYVVFNQFNTSSWLGLNLSRITVHQLDKELKSKLISDKKLSGISSFAAFTPYTELYTVEDKYFSSKTGIEVLDQTVKKNGRTNFNNSGYLIISKQALSDAFYIIKNHPGIYLRGIAKAFTLYFDSPTKYNLLTANTFRIKTYNKLFDAFIYGSSVNTKTGYFSIITNLLILLISGFLLLNKKLEFNVRVFIFFAVINILYVMFVGNLLEVGENNRFRYYTEIFSFLLLGIIINELIIKKFTNNAKKN